MAITPSAATLLVSRTAPARGVGEVLLRALSLSPEATARSGVRSWEMRLAVDCPGRRVRPGETLGYSGLAPGGEALPLAPAEAAWRRPNVGSTLEAAWRAMCDPGFRGPLGATLQVAEAPDASAPPSPQAPAPAAAPTFARNAIATPPIRRSSAAVQVVSSPAEADARRALAALDGLAGLDTRIEPAQVRGRRVYRGLVLGFATRVEALSFCARLKDRGRDCLVR